MIEKITALFREKIGGEPAFVIRSPGRVNLIGEHTDYNDGFVMPLAVEMATWMAARPREGPGARLYSHDFAQWAEVGNSDPKDKNETGSWRNYFQGVADQFWSKHALAGGWEGVALSDLPIGAGLSSSASFELAVAAAFAAVSDIPWHAREMALLAHRAEVFGAGVNCGTMDQLAVAMGRRDHALLIDCRSLEVQMLPLPPGFAVVILDTSKPRSLAGSAYNERRSQCEAAAALLGKPSLRDVTVDLLKQKETSMDPLLLKRARHVVTENKRVLQAADAMGQGDPFELGRLMNESHESLRLDYEVSCPELDAMVEIARGFKGCPGARMTGAGFGGCAVALVSEEQLDDFSPVVIERYRERTGLEARVHATRAHDGTEALPFGAGSG